MEQFDMDVLVKMVMQPTNLRVMAAVKRLHRASGREIEHYLGGEINLSRILRSCRNLTALGFMRRIPTNNSRAEWEYNEEIANAFIARLMEIF